MKNYTRLTLKERKRIYLLKQKNLSICVIAKRLGKHRATIYRELNRNKEEGYYLPDTAHRLTLKRYRGRPRKIQVDTPVYDYVLRRLKQGWSPEQIAGRLKLENKPYYVCHETIYRYIYKRCNKGMYRYLAKAKSQRGKRYGRKVGSGKYVGIRLIELRPKEVAKRPSSSSLTSSVERKTRYIKLIKNNSRVSKEVMGSIKIYMADLPRKLAKTLTFDQGSEFANFRLLEDQTRCKVYFCYPHSPWQRGTNENMNGRLRRYLPRDTKIQAIDQNMLEQLSKKLNNSPRKCLAFRYPREAIYLHCSTICRTSF